MGHLVDVGDVLLDAFLLVKLLDVAEGRLVGDGLDGAGAVDVVLAEEDLRVLVGNGLVGTGEVQVDIRDLIAVEAEEDGKRDVVAILDERRAADGADFVGKVVAAAVGAVGDELAVLAVRAAPVRRQRVDLGDARHRGDEGRADGTTRADEIAVVVRLLDEALRDEVKDGEAVADDGLELLLEAVLDDLRQVLAVERAGLLVGHLADLLVGARDLRRVEVVRDRLEALDLVGDLARVRHNGLVGRLLAEVLELLEHLVCRAQVERRLHLGVVEALALHEDGAVDAVLRVEEVDVAGRDERLAELLGDLGDLEVDLDEVFIRLDSGVLVAALEEVVVVDGLDLEVVVERGNLHELLVRALLLDGADELAGLAGGADGQAAPVLLDDVFRQARLAVEVAQVRERDELIEVAQAVGVLGEHDDVVGALLQVVLLDKVALHAVDDLEVALAAAQGLGGVRECLHDAVVGDGDGGPAPAVGRLDEVLDGDNSVHAAHRRVRMELDALDLGMVLAALLLLLGEAVDEEHVLVHEGVEAHGTLHAHGHALFERGHDFIAVGLRLAALAAASLREELLAGDAVGVVRDAEGQELRARLELEQADARARALANRALDDDALDLADKLCDLVERARDATTKDEIIARLYNDGLVRVLMFLDRLFRRLSRLGGRRCGGFVRCAVRGRGRLVAWISGCR